MTDKRSLTKSHLVAIAAAVLVFCAAIFYSVQLGTNDEVKSAVITVLTALPGHPEIDESQFQVSAIGGIVTISGTIEDENIRPLIIEQVKQVEGVERVIDQIIVIVPNEPTNRK